jgi:hypothetical protein
MADIDFLKKYHEPWNFRIDLEYNPLLTELKTMSDDQIKSLTETDARKYVGEWERVIGNENTWKTPNQLLLDVRNLSEDLTKKASWLIFPKWIMDRFKEAMDQYARGEWVSSIALCGAIVEFIVGDFFEVDEYKQGISVRDQNRSNNLKANLLVLKAYNILRDEDYQRLDDVRKKRNSYIHPQKVRDAKSQRGDNLFVLSRLCEFFAVDNIFSKYQKYLDYATTLDQDS